MALLILFLYQRACSDSRKGSGLPDLELWVNGTEILENAHRFMDGDQEIYIASLDGLDIISRVQKDSSAYRLQIRLFNAGKERVDITSLRLWSTEGLRAEEGWLWSFRSMAGEDGKGLELELSSSSLVLLPGEEIRLPGLMLFLPSL